MNQIHQSDTRLTGQQTTYHFYYSEAVPSSQKRTEGP